jgi:hypothetical protein
MVGQVGTSSNWGNAWQCVHPFIHWRWQPGKMQMLIPLQGYIWKYLEFG